MSSSDAAATAAATAAVSAPLELIPLAESLHSLDHIAAQYRVDWPLSLVITEACMADYRCIFSFFLRVKRVAHELNDLWMRLQQTSSFIVRRPPPRRDMTAKPYNSASASASASGSVLLHNRRRRLFRGGSVAQWTHVRGVWWWRVRQLHLYRHEMQHLITVFQGYLITQVLPVDQKREV